MKGGGWGKLNSAESLPSTQLQDGMHQIEVLSAEVGEGNGKPLQYSCLENPMDGGAWQAAVHGVATSRSRLSDFTFTFTQWRRKKQPTPVFLPGESQGWQSLVGCCLWGRTESDTTEETQQQQQQRRGKMTTSQPHKLKPYSVPRSPRPLGLPFHFIIPKTQKKVPRVFL